jgi:hypothetical protein
MHKLVLKSNKVVEMVMTTKDEGMKDMEEGMKNEVEAMKNREVEARTKGKRKGGGNVEREILLKEKAKKYKEYLRRDKPKKNKSNNKTQHLKKGGVNHRGSLSNQCGQFIENEEMDILKDNEVRAFGNSSVLATLIVSLGGVDGVPINEN